MSFTKTSLLASSQNYSDLTRPPWCCHCCAFCAQSLLKTHTVCTSAHPTAALLGARSWQQPCSVQHPSAAWCDTEHTLPAAVWPKHHWSCCSIPGSSPVSQDGGIQLLDFLPKAPGFLLHLCPLLLQLSNVFHCLLERDGMADLDQTQTHSSPSATTWDSWRAGPPNLHFSTF